MRKLLKFAKVVNGVVTGIQFAVKKPNDPLLIDCGDMVEIGDTYSKNKFTKKDVENKVIRHITPDAMQDRFYFEEKVLIVGSADPRVKAFYDDLRFRKRAVDLDSPRFRLAMDLLLELNIIEQGRDLEILQDGQPNEQV